MAVDFSRSDFLSILSAATDNLETAAELGRKLGRQGFKRLYFVGCGAPNRGMSISEYWIQRTALNLEVRRYFPAEFVNQSPAALDEKTLVVLGSHSGTTMETVEAAKFLEGKACTTVSVTQKSDSPLGKSTTHVMTYGESASGYYAAYMLTQAFVSGFMDETEGNWTLHDKIMSSLKALPLVLADAAEKNDPRATDDARIYKDDRVMYILGSGPMFSTAYVTGVCVLVEMLWMHVHPVEAAEFFHGPFEVIDQTIPVILLVGEDPSRPEAERAVRFCKKYTERLMIYDSKNYAMPGIAEEVRPIVAPLVLEAALSRFPAHLSVWHNHPLTTRRYMWKTEY
ncbi:MAG: SIS domain-containing protein [Chloroflexi bacterium]|nr:SIS domain-containing protein [Chloroflexota bacterium]